MADGPVPTRFLSLSRNCWIMSSPFFHPTRSIAAGGPKSPSWSTDFRQEVVFNNGALGFIKLEQKSTGFLNFGTELKNPNFAAMAEAVKQGVVVVQSSRAGSGRIFLGKKLVDAGILAAGNLNPQKARLLLALALTRTTDPAEIARMFATY